MSKNRLLIGLMLPLLTILLQRERDAPIEWLQPMTQELGDLRHGDSTVVDFKFKNLGKDSLRIDNVRTSCGCTSPYWDEIAIAPGAEGKIQIIYDAEDLGYFAKWIKVYFNGYRRGEQLLIEGYVE